MTNRANAFVLDRINALLFLYIRYWLSCSPNRYTTITSIESIVAGIDEVGELIPQNY